MEEAPISTGLDAEFYLLVLAAVYHADGLWGEATFDLYARQLPEGHGFMVAAGVEEAVDRALSLSISPDDVAWLKEQDAFRGASRAFWDDLGELRFTGEIHAVPEGTVVFPGEPILRVTAPLVEASLLETTLIQAVSHATAVGSRAARLVLAAGGRQVFDFGSRRLPGPEASALAGRAAIVGGCAGTTSTVAARIHGLPVMGTLSSTFLAAYQDDAAALAAFSTHFPGFGYVTLPGGDPLDGVERLLPFREHVKIVRVDHWDLGRSARLVRRALDRCGMERVRILGSGGLDEARVLRLARSDAPLDMLAVGRHLAVGEGDPGTSMAWRLAEIRRGVDPEPVTRGGAALYPGRKQVLRMDRGDMICLEHELPALVEQGGVPLLLPFAIQGRRVRPRSVVSESRDRLQGQLRALPEGVRDLEQPVPWPIAVSDGLAMAALR